VFAKLWRVFGQCDPIREILGRVIAKIGNGYDGCEVTQTATTPIDIQPANQTIA
jgi:hypothetical protein